MAVSLVWSTTNGGSALTDDIDHGSKSNGQTSTAQTIYVRHTGTNPITNAKLYLRPYTGTYSGDASALADFNELIAWGDATGTSFGGFCVNMNATGTFPVGSWPTSGSKSPSEGYVCRTGTADSSTNAVLLSTATGCSDAGLVPAGSSPNVRFQVCFVVPSTEDTVGVRQVDQALLFTYTS